MRGRPATEQVTQPKDSSLEFTKRFVIEYADTDKMGVLHNARYARLFEDTLSDWLRARGSSLTALEQMGLCLPIREKRLKFIQPLRLEDEVFVRMKASFRPGRPVIRFHFEVRLGDSIVTRAVVTHVLCKYRRDAGSGAVSRMVPIPADWLISIA